MRIWLNGEQGKCTWEIPDLFLIFQSDVEIIK